MQDQEMLALTRKNFPFRIWWPAFAWLLLITLLSIVPGADVPRFVLFSADKLGHAAVYGILTWLALRGMTRAGWSVGRMGWQAFAFAAAYGVLMEFVQYAFVPGRFYEYGDMLANALGAAAAWGLYRLFYRRA